MSMLNARCAVQVFMSKHQQPPELGEQWCAPQPPVQNEHRLLGSDYSSRYLDFDHLQIERIMS